MLFVNATPAFSRFSIKQEASSPGFVPVLSVDLDQPQPIFPDCFQTIVLTRRCMLLQRSVHLQKGIEELFSFFLILIG
jgi:hypothetical protein